MCGLSQTFLSDMLIIDSPLLERNWGIGVYFTSRLGGVSRVPYRSLNLDFEGGDDKKRVEENRKRVSRRLNLGSYLYHLRQVHSSDMVLVDRSLTAVPGDIVIAEIDKQWTIKYLRKRGQEIYLEPANKKFSNIYPSEELKIAAVVKAVIRKY